MRMEALKLENVTKHYDGFTLDNVSLSLPRGCIMGFIGENGAGKSTTIKLIMDLIRRDSGSITVLDKDNLRDMAEIKEHLGVVLDECCFPENLTAQSVNRVMANIYKTWNENKYWSMVNQFSLSRTKVIKDYSRGMKMKLAIAVALSHDTRLLILDEATSGLDPIVRDEILDVFLEFIQDEGNSVFMSTHIVSDLEKISDYITLIHKGKILFTQNKDVLLESYGILKCSQQDFQALDPAAVKGHRENAFGVEALVMKNQVPGHLTVDRASIEEIMLYYIKGAKSA